MINMIELYLDSQAAKQYFDMIHCNEFKDFGKSQMVLVGSEDTFTFAPTGIEFETTVTRYSSVLNKLHEVKGIATIPYHIISGMFRYEQEGENKNTKVVGFSRPSDILQP